MGREIRNVPENWEHPLDTSGQYIPLLNGDFKAERQQWEIERKKWFEGYTKSYNGHIKWKPKVKEYENLSFEEYSGGKPVESDYMPQWDENEKTQMRMYEDCTEGTPISPAFDTVEKLAQWLTDNNASAFGSMTATYSQWLATCKKGYALSMVMTSKGISSGVEANQD